MSDVFRWAVVDSDQDVRIYPIPREWFDGVGFPITPQAFAEAAKHPKNVKLYISRCKRRGLEVHDSGTYALLSQEPLPLINWPRP